MASNIDFNKILNSTKEWFRNLPEKIKKFPEWFKNLPNDEKGAWIAIYVGIFFIILSLFLL